MSAELPPPIRPVNVAGIPSELATRPQWVCWVWERVDDRWTKVPYSARSGHRASSTDVATWTSLDAAISHAERHTMSGIGFVVTRDDPFVGIDLDQCRDPRTGAIEAWAHRIVDHFDSWTEITPSQTGLRIWITTKDGLLPGGEQGRRTGKVEIYGAGRFFTVTGHQLVRSAQ